MHEIATHEPAPGSNFVIRVDLDDHGMPGRGEQLWALQVGPTRFRIQSLPFFAYGLRPGDEVETDDSFTVQRLVHSSGTQVLRIASTEAAADGVHADLHSLLETLGLSHEWHRIGYVAVELASDALPGELASYLDAKADEGQLFFELA